MSGGGGFMSFMNSTIRKNRQLLKKKKKFKERNQLYNVVNPDKVNYEIRDVSEEEIMLRKKLKKSEKEKTTNLYLLTSIIIFSVSLNVYLGFFNSEIEKKGNPSHDRLEKLHLVHNKVGDVYFQGKNWDSAIGNYKISIKNFPEKFNGHQRLILALTEKCKEKNYESCIEARNYIDDIRNIFLEKKNELNKYLNDIDKYQKRLN